MDEMQEPTVETDMQQNQTSKVECSRTDWQEATSSGGVTAQAGEAEGGDAGDPLKKKLKASAYADGTTGTRSDERKAKPGTQTSSREASAVREESQEKKDKKTDSLQKRNDAAGGNK